MGWGEGGKLVHNLSSLMSGVTAPEQPQYLRYDLDHGIVVNGESYNNKSSQW